MVYIYILKQCSWRNCTKIVEDGVIYCTYHQLKWDKENKERYKEYNNKRKMNKEQKKYQDFYNSKHWRKLRDVVINKYYGIDILEYYRTGRIVQGQALHHIVSVSEDYNRRLDISNLIYLTEKNHRRVHEEYLKGKKEKEEMQKILFELVEKFNTEFGN